MYCSAAYLTFNPCSLKFVETGSGIPSKDGGTRSVAGLPSNILTKTFGVVDLAPPVGVLNKKGKVSNKNKRRDSTPIDLFQSAVLDAPTV